jgi:hypothetical protein
MKPRRMVRCARCGNEWAAVQEAEASGPDAATAESGPAAGGTDPEADLAMAFTALDRFTAPRPPRQPGLIAAWLATALIMAAAAAAAVAWRAEAVRAWPPAARLLGQPEPAAGATAPETPAKRK